ncbi:MAG: RluA family pseudouridine synthase [Bacteroidales bacterium]|nr:RluA family pseudouridine synthase [Bacteroidales bacterium]
MNTENEESQELELYENHRFTVDKGQEMMRMDKYLQMRIEGVSRTKIQAAAKAKCILVNSKPEKSSYKIKPLDVISVLLPTPPREIEITPENIPFTIVYEDDDVLVVDKQAGLVVHPGYGNFNGTLLNALAYYFDGKKGKDGNPVTPYLVHRIDKDTSGLLLIAKNEEAQVFLAKQFFDHTIERKYKALVWGDFPEEKGTVDGNLARSVKDRRVMAVYNDPEIGKHAVTHWNVVERFGYVTLIECILETGRTHQIRAHMKHIGHPLFNDAAYGGDQILKGTTFSKYRQFVNNCFQLMPRQALHAFILGFEHPSNHKQMHFESAMPDDFAAVLDKWRRYSVSAKEDLE